MFSNPITSILGLIAVLCPILGNLFPDIEPICRTITGEAIGLGLIAAKDGIKSPFTMGTVNRSIFLILGSGLLLASTFYGCSTLLSAKNQIETVIAAQSAGTYTVSITKDGQQLYVETWDCTTDGQKLTGCHKR